MSSFRFHRRVSLGKGLTLNLGKTGASLSMGVTGAKLTGGLGKDTRVTLGIPGTGLFKTFNLSAEERREASNRDRKARADAKRDRDRAREHERFIRQREREAKRKERELATAQAQQTKERQLVEWKNEVDEYNEYINELTSFHCMPADLKLADKEYEARATPRHFEERVFIPRDYVAETYTPDVYQRKYQQKVAETYDASSNCQACVAKLAKFSDFCIGIVSLLTIIHLGFGIYIGMMDGELAQNVANSAIFATLCALFAVVVYTTTKFFMRVMSKRAYLKARKKDIAELEVELVLEQNFFEREKQRADEFQKKEQDRRAKFDAAEAQRLERFKERDIEERMHFEGNEPVRVKVLQTAKEGDNYYIAQLCEALFPLDIDMAGPEWCNAALLKDYSVGYHVESSEEVWLLIELPDFAIIPEYGVALSPSERAITYPTLSKRARVTLYDNFAASFSLAHAQLLFLSYPYFKSIYVESYIPSVDEATGFYSQRTILQGYIAADSLQDFNFPNTNPIAALKALGVAVNSFGTKLVLQPTMTEEDIIWAVTDDNTPLGLLPLLSD